MPTTIFWCVFRHHDNTAWDKIAHNETAQPQNGTATNDRAIIQQNIKTAQWQKSMCVAVPEHSYNQFVAVTSFSVIGDNEMRLPIEVARP